MEFDSRLDSIGIARKYEDRAEALESLYDAIKAIDEYDLCAMAAMNRAIAEFYRHCGKNVPAYTTGVKVADFAYQIYSVDFLRWLLEKAKEDRLD